MPLENQQDVGSDARDLIHHFWIGMRKTGNGKKSAKG